MTSSNLRHSICYVGTYYRYSILLFFRNGSAFEAMTKTKQENNPKFAFLFGGQYYHYYSYKVATEQQLQRQRAAKEAANNTPRPLMELDLGGGVGGVGGGGFYGGPAGGGFGGGTSWGGPPEAPRTAPLKEQLAGLQAQQATLQTQIRQSEQVSQKVQIQKFLVY